MAGERKPVAPAGASNPRPYSPAILTGEYLYVSGQLGLLSSGTIAPMIEEQTKLVLNQIKTLVEAGGLTMEHVVSTQLFLTDARNYETINKIYATYFPGVKPSRVTVGVARLPAGAGVEITAVAVRDANAKQPVNRQAGTGAVPISEGIKTKDRFFLSGTLGRDADTGKVPEDAAEQVRISFQRAKSVLKLAGLTEAALVSFNVFHTRAISEAVIRQVSTQEFGKRIKAPVSMIEVNEMAMGTHVGVTGVAALDAKQIQFYKRCAALGETLYCAVEQSATGPVEQQTRDAVSRLSASAKAAGFQFENASATQLYLDNMEDFENMNAAYRSALKEPRPARATIQPAAPAGKRLVQISVVVSK